MPCGGPELAKFNQSGAIDLWGTKLRFDENFDTFAPVREVQGNFSPCYDDKGWHGELISVRVEFDGCSPHNDPFGFALCRV